MACTSYTAQTLSNFYIFQRPDNRLEYNELVGVGVENWDTDIFELEITFQGGEGGLSYP